MVLTLLEFAPTEAICFSFQSKSHFGVQGSKHEVTKLVPFAEMLRKHEGVRNHTKTVIYFAIFYLGTIN